MRPYGMKKRCNKVHPHNECGICGSNPPSKGTARSRLKKDTKNQIKDEQ